MIKRVVLIVVALSATSIGFMARADPRPMLTQECGVPTVSQREASIYADFALAEVSQLLRDARYIYGPYNRAEQRLIDLGHYLGAPATSNPAYRKRIGAAFAELSLIWEVSKALGQSPCSTQHGVPDHRSDSMESAVAKLQSLANVLR